MRMMYEREAWRSSKQTLDDLAVHIGQAKMAALKFEGQTFMIDAEQVQNRRLQIENADRVGDGVVAEIIRLAHHQSAFRAAARQPHHEIARVMIAPVIALRQLALTIDRAPE